MAANQTLCIISLVVCLFLWQLILETGCSAQTGNLKYVYSKIPPDIQTAAGNGVIQRLLQNRSKEFRLEIDSSLSPSKFEDAFKVIWENSTQQVVVSGTTAVSALFGLNLYLKYNCNIQIAWEGVQLNNAVNLPHILPRVAIGGPILDRFRYYQNVCTEGYSFAWWDWTQWEKHIDWMAINGINFPLAFTGQEAIWGRVYLSLGLTLDEIEDYMTGPAFLPWWRMGNLQKWGGPLPRSYANKKLQLLHKILERMRSLGMIPILPAFAGNVPNSLPKLFPNSTFTQHPSWARFNSTYSKTYLIDPTDPLFVEIGKRFNRELVTEFGTDHVYNCDTFNENQPSSSNSTFLRAMSKATFKSMLSGDPKAVWMMQSWAFKGPFWTKQAVQSYLSGVQVGNAIVLDLYAEMLPLYKEFDSFYNHSFIWCMLHNFGGLVNLYGQFDRVNEGVYNARKQGENITMVGTGMCPEGINQNFVAYDFMTEMSVAKAPVDVDQWIRKYSNRRYETSNPLLEDSWSILKNGVYQAPVWVGVRGAAVITGRPNVNMHEMVWYPLTDMQVVVEKFVFAAEQPELRNSPLFLHDLVDFTRQFLQHLGGLAYENMIFAYKTNRTAKFQRLSASFLSIFDDLEHVLKTNPKFMLGEWTRSAESWGTTDEEIKLLRFNSLNQITLWGPTGEIIDYAAKQWSGMISNYYKPRWSLFISYLNKSLATATPFNQTVFNEDVLANVEIPFTQTPTNSELFLTTTSGNTIDECTRVYKKWKYRYIRFARSYSFKPPICSRRERRFGLCNINTNYSPK